ncbi:hypothetical protein [Streptomyces doebereineriae]|uniref:Uncharacterized protein n=1 Tax=Streptomyces doebereineriae TaxID=3075528 RepID=A0ABU2V9D5_9ACTN|nr:hypothetical protein [Streptomyces sp. DSM 41640]MDT0482181.1 hypothetical protein [Streptomyces sp. DSM 41640]
MEGFAEDGYGQVRRVLQELVDEGLESGAAVSVWRDGREVVRLNVGWADAGRSHPWRYGTLVMPLPGGWTSRSPRAGWPAPLPRPEAAGLDLSPARPSASMR